MATEIDFDALWNYGDPAGTEAVFQGVLVEAGEGATAAWRAELITQIARTLGLQRRFDDADALLDEALPLAQDDPRAMARWLLERGRVRNSSGREEEAMPLFEAALERAEAAEADYYAVDALHMMAIAAPPEAQLALHRRAIDRAASSKEDKARNWRASLLNNLGWTLHDAGEYAPALATFEEALAARQEQGKEDPIRIAQWTVGRCLRSLGRVQEALRVQESLHKASPSDGFVEEELGECLMAVGREAEARPHFAAAFETLKKDPWLQDSEPARLERLGRLGSEVEKT